MPTVQQTAAAVRQLAAAEWAEHLTKVMPTVQKPAAAVRQLTAVERP